MSAGPRPWRLSRPAFLEHLAVEYGRTRRLLAAFGVGELDARPAPGMMSARELARHLMGCHHYLLQAAVHRRTGYEHFKVTDDLAGADGPAVAAAFDRWYEALRDGLGSMDEAAFNAPLHVFDRDSTVADLCLEILLHEAHHRGQLAAALRSVGVVPPDVYYD